MTLLRDFMDWFKVRETPILSSYDDGVGVWAFRVNVDGTDFVCAARATYEDGKRSRASCMKRVAGHAQTRDAYVALRIRDDTHVFDPVTILAEGDVEDPHDDTRKNRGEEWVYFDVDTGVTFKEWYDGAEPPGFEDVGSFV